ncbi:thioredoxin family protein [Methanoculleus sp. FWC-SCC1]|uniref:Thioredoxin family protein n=1 Tax=Methanoculleus frigidifontis TaxID=2584085 RepID=A0ABT8MBG4_9EURY|nr:thioredoxin family protein [Methanoculleus sp. FWC-SCC1]MDN7025220.1 thioredoxin family protein [Methanoculleus sp. FWC-SCC1]
MALKVLSFYQDGCMACGEQEPILQEVKKDLGIDIDEVNAVKEPQYIKEFGLRVTPTTLVLVDGEVKERMEGLVHREDLETSIRKYTEG